VRGFPGDVRRGDKKRMTALGDQPSHLFDPITSHAQLIPPLIISFIMASLPWPGDASERYRSTILIGTGDLADGRESVASRRLQPAATTLLVVSVHDFASVHRTARDGLVIGRSASLR
jgi:hypothetical protein